MTDDAELAQLRAQMDEVNRRLVGVLHDRARLCRQIGSWKRRHGVAAIDPAREQAMLAAALEALPPDGFSREQLAAVLRAVFLASREVVTAGP